MIQESRYATAIASAKLLGDNGMIDLTEDEFAFLVQSKPWHGTDRNHAKRCVESVVYGALDMLGMPRFPAPAEFIATAIAFYVHPVNIQVACSFMDGCEFSEYIVDGVDQRVTAAELFAHTLHVRAGLYANIRGKESSYLDLIDKDSQSLSSDLKEA